MSSGLKITLISSIALAAVLNIIQAAAGYGQSAQAAFAPAWAVGTSSAQPSPSVAAASPIAPTPTPTPTPASQIDPLAAAQARLTASRLKPQYAGNYLAVQAKTGTPWQLLAAVHQTETGQSGDTAVKSSAGATGPMQFMPATFAHYAVDGDLNGTKDITDLDDALLTAGRYLAAGGADKGRYTTALYNYNHSNAYVSHVLSIAKSLGL
jgi:membrane-bound lytic murein transglycosylase B